MDLYSVGEMLVDFLPGSEPGSYIRNAGGAPANVAIAAARNGLEAAMCCSVGDDDFGRYLLGTLRENRVRCIRREPCREAVTTMAFVSLTEEGERSFTFVRKPGADMFLREEDVREADIRDTVIVHAGSCSLSASPAAEATAKALHLGREMGRLVSFDVNYRDMNMWGLTLDFLDVLEEGFKEFFEKEVPGNPLKAEYLIPSFIGELLEQGKMSVKVLRTNDTWYGMTYHEDVAAVKDSFKKMLVDGMYKADLFSDL